MKIKVEVDLSKTLQQIDGWGTSLCWFANAIGGWSEKNRMMISDLLFSRDKGLGLNVIRYNIWGGDNPHHNHMRTGSKAKGFLSADGVWDWQADKNQQRILFDAKERGADFFEAFSNSPPYWMTRSQCSAGAENGGSNLKEECYTDFADYLTEVIKHYKQTYNFEFQTLEPVNEPRTNFWKKYNRQEGCYFSPEQQERIIKEVQAKLIEKNLTTTEVSASDENSIDMAVDSWNSYAQSTKNIVQQINTHSYEGTKRAELRKLAGESGKRLWMSEYGNGGGSGHNHSSMQAALEMSTQIIKDMNGLCPSAWVYWQAVEDEAGTVNENGNWGFIHADMAGSSEQYHITKKYYAMAHFSKFIHRGYFMLETNAENIIAFCSSDKSKLVIVANNDSMKSIEYKINLTNADNIKATAIYRTSASENMKLLEDVQAGIKSISICLEPASISTYVIKLVVDEL